MSLLTPAAMPVIVDQLLHAVEQSNEQKDNVLRKESRTLELTDWCSERPDLTSDFTCSPLSRGIRPNLKLVPSESQEAVLLRDLLKVLIGIDSDLIQAEPLTDRYATRKFSFSTHIVETNLEVVKNCLPLATFYSIIARFLDDSHRLSVGRVNQAFAAGVREYIGNYLHFVGNLDDKNRAFQLHLHEMWYCIQPVLMSMNLLSDLVSTIMKEELRGGRTLSLLDEHLTKLSAIATPETELCRHLMKLTASPYMESIKQWIYYGKIYDPFDEFMVVETPKMRKEVNSDKYWEKKYHLRCSNFSEVPSFLMKVQCEILDSGKYLNVIRECVKSDVEIEPAPEEDLAYSENKEFLAVILRAYKHWSKTLLTYIIEEYNVLDRITSAKKYFLLQQGDFVLQILDTCHEELVKDVNDVEPSRLASLVEMAIRIPSTNDDVHRENITSCLKPLDLASQVKKILGKGSRSDDDSSISNQIHQISGFESFTLAIKCEWPVSLVLNTKVQSVYQMLFRHLFFCKHVERLLNATSIWHKGVRRNARRLPQPLRAAMALRNKMMCFLQNVEYYMTVEAIEPAWIHFLDSVKSCESIDDLITVHWNFLDRCMTECLLYNMNLLSVFRDLLGTCKDFANILTSLRSMSLSSINESLLERVQPLESQFHRNIRTFFEIVADTAGVDVSEKLLNRQDFNYYYTNLFSAKDQSSLDDISDK